MTRRWTATAVLALAGALTVTGCSSATETKQQPAARATVVPVDEARVPAGWTTWRGPGFRVSLPPEWQPRPEGQRSAPGAAVEVGLPYTGQRHPQPLFTGFVEREQVGTLVLREQVLRMQLRSALPRATAGSSTHVRVAGTTDAVSFDLLYRDAPGTSVFDTPIDATDVRQWELIVETPGLPKFGFRYAAERQQFDEVVWKQVLASIVVLPAEAGASTPTPS